MAKYKVTFVAYSRQEAEVEVEADSVEEAQELAEEKGEDEGYDWKSDDYYWEQSVIEVVELK